MLIVLGTESITQFRGRKKGAAHLSVFADRIDKSAPLYLANQYKKGKEAAQKYENNA